jgi:hypothetical protein
MADTASLAGITGSGSSMPPTWSTTAARDKGADAGTTLFPMIELGVRTARSPRESCPHPRFTPRVAAAQRLLTATLPTPWAWEG